MLKIEAQNYQFCPYCGDELQIKIEEGKERKFCPKDSWTHYPRVAAAAVAVICEDRQTLLVQRNRDPFKGSWGFPAGFIDYGEYPEEALYRELKEETGLKAVSCELINIIQCEDDTREPGHFAMFYKVKATGIINPIDLEENQDIQWFSLDDLPKEIGWKHHLQILKLLKKGKI